MKLTPVLAVLAFVVACGPAPELKRRQFVFTEKLTDGRINLDNKSPTEVLRIKYNNDVRLECDFRAANTPDKDPSDIDPKKISWNLVNSVDKTRTITFDNGDRKLEVEITPKMIVYGSYLTPKKNGVQYKLQHTPVVELTLRPLINNIQQEPRVDNLFENIPGESFAFGDDGDVNLLTCALKATIQPLYEVESVKIEDKIEEEAQPSQESVNPSGQENASEQEGPATGTH